MEKKHIPVAGTPGLVKPLFADAVQTTIGVKETKNKKERIGHVRLTFIDMLRRQVLAEIVIDHLHARELARILSENVKNLDIALKTGKHLPKPEATKTEMRYIG